jgi:hypothetical protein
MDEDTWEVCRPVRDPLIRKSKIFKKGVSTLVELFVIGCPATGVIHEKKM